MLGATEVGHILAATLPENVWTMYREGGLGSQIARFLELLVRWNEVVSLTSVRSPEEMVRRHFAESLCCAAVLPRCESMLDLGSGAGFPGIPVQLMRPGMRVTLAESNGKKAAFLREVVRELGLETEVFTGRAQDLPERSFACVCLRAVDPMTQALEAASMLAVGNVCVVGSPSMKERYGAGLVGWKLCGADSCLSGGAGSVVYRYMRTV